MEGHTQLRFFQGDLRALREVFSAYEEIRVAFAADQDDRISLMSAKLEGALVPFLETGHESIPAEIYAVLEQAVRSARNFVGQSTAIEARNPFGIVSEGLFRLAQSDTRLGYGWHVFRCLMVEGFNKWFQRGNRIENPYMGQKMLSCGAESDWSLGAPSPSSAPSCR